MPDINDPNEPSKKPFSFIDTHQKKIYKKLRLVSLGTASYYKDACRIKSENPPFDSTTHLIGHLLREIESSLRKVMLPQGFVKPKGRSDTQKCQVEEIIKVYGISNNEGGDIWLDLADEKSNKGLYRWAHRDALSKARSADMSFNELWNDVQIMLEGVLDRLESNYAQYVSLIDTLIAKKKISESDVEALKQKIPNSDVVLIRFFDHVTDPQWLPLLNNADIFNHIPDPILHDNGGVSYPYWPQVTYLKKMAIIPGCQDLIVEICLKIDTENIRARADVIDIVLELPANQAVKLTLKFIDWIDTIQSWLQPSRYGKLITYLASKGYGDEAIAVAKALLKITPDPKEPIKVPAEKEGETYELPQDPRALFDDHEYEQILKEDYPSLLPTYGEKAVNLLVDLLTDVIVLRKPKRIQPEDYSTIWQPAIENHGENYRHGVKSILVAALRDTSEQYIKTDCKLLPIVVENLQKRKYVIFQRLALYLIKVFAKCSPALVSSTLLNKSLFNHHSLHHEYFMLAQEQFVNLTKKEQLMLLGWIETGADVGTYKKHCKQNKFKYTQENIDRYVKVWQRDRLAPIKDSLSKTWKERFETLVKEVGEPDGLMFMSVVTGGSFGPKSPKTNTELKSLSLDDLVKYLQEWQPSKEIHGDSEEGLGREIMELVKGDSLSFSKHANKFIGLRPTYVRNLLRALWEVANQSGQIDWEGVLKLCTWVVKQPKKDDEDEETKFNWNNDPGWGWSYNTIAELLQVGFRAGSSEIPWKYRTVAWQILEKITHDSDPTPESEVKHLEGSDPASLSFNTTRGDAMHTVIEYAVWCQRHLKKERGGFKEIPEVQKVLEDHLDVSNDPSVIIRSIYGEKFNTLTYLDKTWAKEHVEQIFPKGEKEYPLWAAAWGSYVLYSQPYHEVYDLIKGEYLFAVSQLGNIKHNRKYSTDVDHQFEQHLMTLYWSGKIKLEDDLLTQFYTVASDDLRYSALDFVGRTFHNAKEPPVPAEFIPRLQALWENRLEAVKKSGVTSSKELSAFGWWFDSGIFPEEWAILNLIEALKLAEKIYPDTEIIERLVAYVPKRPEQVVETINLMVESDTEGWRVLSSKEVIRQIIEAIKQTNNRIAIEKAGELVNKLIAKGYADDFKDLL